MTMNPLPPQAYTKDTLVKAFQWIQLQGPDIKQLASTPDVLVSLYLKAKLQGEAVLERPSIQNFKNELKNLAGQLGEFAPAQELVNERAFDQAYAKASTVDAPQFAERPQQVQFQFHSQAAASPAMAPSDAPAAPAAAPQPQPATPAPSAAPAPTAATTAAAMTAAAAVAAKQGLALDDKTAALVREVRELSNLQSDAEAIRLLISIGHKQLKQLYR